MFYLGGIDMQFKLKCGGKNIGHSGLDGYFWCVYEIGSVVCPKKYKQYEISSWCFTKLEE